MAQLRILIAGGGTGGHIIPALAVARELVDRHGAEVLLVGTARGLETRLVPAAGFALRLIDVGPLKSVSLMTRLRTLSRLPGSIGDCKQMIREFRPGAVLGVGGYASGPAMIGGALAQNPHHGLRAQRHARPGQPSGGQARATGGHQFSRSRLVVPKCRSHRRSRAPAVFLAARAGRSAAPAHLWRLARRADFQHASTQADAGVVVRGPGAHGSAPVRSAPRRCHRRGLSSQRRRSVALAGAAVPRRHGRGICPRASRPLAQRRHHGGRRWQPPASPRC